MMKFLIFFTLLLVISKANIRGVSPKDQIKYQGKKFTCFDGSKTLLIESVNDVSSFSLILHRNIVIVKMDQMNLEQVLADPQEILNSIVKIMVFILNFYIPPL